MPRLRRSSDKVTCGRAADEEEATDLWQDAARPQGEVLADRPTRARCLHITFLSLFQGPAMRKAMMASRKSRKMLMRRLASTSSCSV